MPTHFERLGLPGRFDLSTSDLEAAYLRLSREVHPDFHGNSGDLDRNASNELSSSLNGAYAVLRDPFRRADYLLTLLGGPAASELKDMPKAFLMDMMDLREQLEAAKNDAERGLLEDDISGRQRELLQTISALFAKMQESITPQLGADIRRSLNAGNFLSGLMRDLRNSG